MERAYLGQTGLRVTRLILGCGNFGGVGSAPAFFGKGETKEEAFALMDAAWEAGITTFDTADAYGGGRSETWIGDWLRTKGADVRDEIVLSTKTFAPMDEGEDHGLAPERVKRQVESSLKRLGVDHVQMFLTHAPDPDVPIAETAGALDELVAAGKIGALRRQQRRRRAAARRARRRQLRVGAELVLAPRPGAGARKCCRCAQSTASASRRSARSRAAGSRASTAATRRRPQARG